MNTPLEPDTIGQGMWPTLHPTTQAAFNQILWHRGLSKSEVAVKLGLSRTRMTTIARDLESAGLIEEAGREQRAVTGRPAEMLRARASQYHHLGVHIRAAEVVATVIDLNQVVVWERRTTDVELTQEWVLASVVRWCEEARADGMRVAAIAVCGSAQKIDGAPDGIDLHTLVDVHALEQIATATESAIWAEDDVAALTAFEQWPLLNGDQDSMALLSVGFEIGVGQVTHQAIVYGSHRRAGRWSHTMLANDGPECDRGHHGCFWGLSSVTSMTRQTGLATLDEVLSAADAGDAVAQEALRLAAWGLGAASADIVNLSDPHKLVLTGECGSIVAGREAVFDEAYRSVACSEVRPDLEITSFDFLEWARAAAAYALYRTLTEVVD